jgi:uncharacterized protein with HEPN domain
MHSEAAKRVDDQTRTLAPDIPWREVTSLRDVLVHDYLEIDLDLVWNVVDTECRLFVRRFLV